MQTALLHDVVDREVLQAGIFRKGLAVSGLADPRSTRNNDIWLRSHRSYMPKTGFQNVLCGIFFYRLKDSAALVGNTDKAGEGGERARDVYLIWTGP